MSHPSAKAARNGAARPGLGDFLKGRAGKFGTDMPVKPGASGGFRVEMERCKAAKRTATLDFRVRPGNDKSEKNAPPQNRHART